MTLDDLDVNDARNAADYLRGVRGTEKYGRLTAEWAAGARWNLGVALRTQDRAAACYWLARLITSGRRPEEPRR